MNGTAGRWFVSTDLLNEFPENRLKAGHLPAAFYTASRVKVFQTEPDFSQYFIFVDNLFLSRKRDGE
jgi:hypothetical protein